MDQRILKKTSSWAENKRKRTDHFLKNVFGWRLEKCGACSGSGYYDNTGSPKCGACEGTGRTRYKSVRNILGNMRFYVKETSDTLPGKPVHVLKVLDGLPGDGMLKIGYSDPDVGFVTDWIHLDDLDLSREWE